MYDDITFLPLTKNGQKVTVWNPDKSCSERGLVCVRTCVLLMEVKDWVFQVPESWTLWHACLHTCSEILAPKNSTCSLKCIPDLFNLCCCLLFLVLPVNDSTRTTGSYDFGYNLGLARPESDYLCSQPPLSLLWLSCYSGYTTLKPSKKIYFRNKNKVIFNNSRM